VIVEEQYGGGRAALTALGVPVEALAIIERVEGDETVLA
jgi:hypothetical protein